MEAHVNPPDTLRVPTFEETDEFWHRPCDIGQWRDLVVYKTECKETADRMEIVQWKIQPSDELRLRSAEIVAAFEAWYGKKPRGYKAERELKRAERAYIRLEEKSTKCLPTQWKGCKQKSDAPKSGGGMGSSNVSGGCEEAMALSIFNDIRRMTDTAAS
jgi:hypothetical protein